MKRIKTIVKEFPEFIVLPLAILAFFATPHIIRLAYPIAGELDPSIFQFFALGVSGTMLFNALAFAAIKFNFPKQYKWYTRGFRSSRQFWQFFSLLALYLLSLVLTLVAVV